MFSEALNSRYFINICVRCCLKVSVTYYLDRSLFFIAHVSPSGWTIVCSGSFFMYDFRESPFRHVLIYTDVFLGFLYSFIFLFFEGLAGREDVIFCQYQQPKNRARRAKMEPFFYMLVRHRCFKDSHSLCPLFHDFSLFLDP